MEELQYLIEASDPGTERLVTKALGVLEGWNFVGPGIDGVEHCEDFGNVLGRMKR